MKACSYYVGTLIECERMPSSRNGNLRYRLFIGTEASCVSCVTAPDSSLGYTVTNYRGKRVKATIGTHYGRATLRHIERILENSHSSRNEVLRKTIVAGVLEQMDSTRDMLAQRSKP